MTTRFQELLSHYQPVRDAEESDFFRIITAEDDDAAQVAIYEVQRTAEFPSSLQSRFKHEIQRFSAVAHERFCGPADFEFSNDAWQIVCPSKSLQRLSERLQTGLTVSETLSVAADLLAVIQSIHDAGLVLRCLSPADIFVQQEDAALRAILAGCPPLMLLHGFHNAGSPGAMLIYGAPETLGVLEHDIQPAADLYSFGALLFECLTGTPPFTGETSRELLFHHVTSPVPDLCSLNANIPPVLSDIVQRLLQKHPRDRYQSAAGVLFDIQQVESAFCGHQGVCPIDQLVLGTKDHRDSLIEPAHVGRERDLAFLETALNSVTGGQSQNVLITAPSGIGKSRLLQAASTVALARGFRLLQGQGQNQTGLSPLATLQPALQACVHLIHEDAALRAALSEQMQDYASELHAVIPEVAFELKLANPDRRDRELSDRRIAVALATLLGNMATAEQPVLLLLDDIQWADDLTLAILDCWQLTSPRRTLLVVSTRPADALADRLRRHLNFTVEIALQPLSRQNSDRLLESMAGILPSEILDVVWDMASGNPFVSSAVLRGLVEGGALTPTDDGWVVDREELRNLHMSGEAAEILKQRLIRLPQASRDLLAVGAVLGKEFCIETAASLLNLPYEQAVQHLIEPRANYLIWEKAAAGICQFVHDQIREAVLETVTSDRLSQIHLAAAEHLVKVTPESHFEIACHYDAAERPQEALPFAVKAADSAHRRHALEIAEQQYQIALNCFEAVSQPPTFEVLNGMGSVLMLSGRYLEAQQVLEAALVAANSPIAKAEISLQLGELAFKRDEKDRAVELWESALRKLNGQLPPNWLMPFYTLKEIAVQTLHTLFPNRLVQSRTNPADLRDRLICRLYSRLAYGYWYLKGKVPLLYVHLRGMNLAEGFAPTAELAQAYSEHAPAMSLIPLSRRGIAYGRRSLEIRTNLEDVWGQGQSLHFLAIALYAAGRFEDCIDVGRRSVRILERAGDFWEKHIAQYQVAASLFRIGRLAEAVQLSREAYDSGLAVGDDQVCGNIIDIWSRATNGDLPAEIIQQELDRPRADVQGRAHVLLARGVQLVNEQRFEDACQVFEDGIKISKAAGISNCYTAPLYVWKATTIRGFLENVSPLIRRSRQQTIRDHRRAAWAALLIGLRFRSELPHALRELAWSFLFKNRIRRAMYLLKWSIRTAQEQSAEYELLLSEQMLQQIRVELGYTDARDLQSEAQERLAKFRNEQFTDHVPTSLSLVDRFDSLLESGRKIASAVDQAEIIASTVTASQHLLRSDFCHVVSVDQEGQPQDICESLRPVVQQTVNSGEALTSEVPTKDFRSLITCPIYVRGDAVACLVVGNKEVRDLFGDNEIRIASYITTICGTALENAEGFHNLRQLNANLENIVSERTAAVEARSAELQKTADSLRHTQGELAAARDVAEVANQAKTDFLAHMSHEIRTPIGAVLGFTELLLRGNQPLQTEQRQHLERVHSNGSHLHQLLNDLLDLSRIEAGELTIENLRCQPFGLLSDTMASLQSRAIDKGLALTLSVKDTIPEFILTDATRLRQIITNLVGNAIKFTARGSVDLVVETIPEQQLLKIHVQDSGVGIPATAQADVFEPFRQADESVNRRFGGTGLGLPISRKLAQALGGDISLTSDEGLGSTFTASVSTGPLTDIRLLSATDVISESPQSPLSRLENVDLSGIRILVADDMEANREYFCHTLQSSGAIIETVENGQEAVMACRRKTYDLILMDMRMPVMDGTTAVRVLRESGAVMPIIALTANGMPEDEQRCRAGGCTGYLTKPISMQTLLSGIAEQLHLHTSVRENLDAAVCSAPTDRESAEPGDAASEISIPQTPFLRKMALKFLAKVDDALPQAFQFRETGDLKSLADQAHWIKGTGGTVGLPIMTRIGIDLERACHAKDDANCLLTLLELQRTMTQCRNMLKVSVPTV